MTEKPTDEELIEQMYETPPEPEISEPVADTPTEEPAAEAEEAEVEETSETLEEPDEPEAEAEDESEYPDEETDEVEEAEILYTVKVDGEERSVNLEELSRGYSGQEYIKKGMQDVAEGRRITAEAQSKIKEYATAMQQERQALAQLATQAKQEGLIPHPTEPTRELFQADPIGYAEAQIDYNEGLKAYNEQQNQINHHQQQAQVQYQQEHQSLVQSNLNSLYEAIPAFRDAEEAPKLVAKLTKYAVEKLGYTAQEVQANVDYRRVVELNRLYELDNIQSGKKAAKVTRQTPKSIKRSTGNKVAGKQLQRQKQLAKAKRTQNPEDFLTLLFE
jgi:hypothetical protein